MEVLLIYPLLGLLAGLLAGLLGVGGGLVIVPALAFLLPAQGVDEAVAMHLAVGTSLATIVLTSVASIRAHHRRRAVRWDLAARLTPGLVGGVLIGAAVADRVPARGLSAIVGLFAVAMALQMALGGSPRSGRALPGPAGSTAAGGGIGLLSALVGIGGGSLTVPFLIWGNVAVRQAVGTAAACGLPIALAGAAGYVVAGAGHPLLPSWATGYVYWPAVLGIVVTSLLAAPVGARLAHTLPTGLLKKIFAAVLALIGARMLVGGPG